MAKIECAPESANSKQKRSKKRKRNSENEVGEGRSNEADSPTSKFKKLDISQIGKRHSSSIDKQHQKQQQQQQSSWPVATVSSSAVSVPQASTASTSASSTVTTAPVLKSEASAENRKPKNKKRKHQAIDSTTASKKRKHTEATDRMSEDDEIEGTINEPTVVEINLANRPENQPQIETTRQKKLAKHAQVQVTAKIGSLQREQLRNREYLQLWRDNRTEWKYNKLRQVSVSKALFLDTDPLDDETWHLAMEYLCGTKGHMRQLMRDAAQKVIDDVDALIGACGSNGTSDAGAGNEAQLLQSVNYGRARTFMQMLE